MPINFYSDQLQTIVKCYVVKGLGYMPKIKDGSRLPKIAIYICRNLYDIIIILIDCLPLRLT
jgi:hypothetical protein